MSAAEFSSCVRSGDWAALVSLPGVGRKTAERLVLDMRDKVDQIFPDLSADEQKPDSTIVDDALAASTEKFQRKAAKDVLNITKNPKAAEAFKNSLMQGQVPGDEIFRAVSYTHLRAHET